MLGLLGGVVEFLLQGSYRAERIFECLLRRLQFVRRVLLNGLVLGRHVRHPAHFTDGHNVLLLVLPVGWSVDFNMVLVAKRCNDDLDNCPNRDRRVHTPPVHTDVKQRLRYTCQTFLILILILIRKKITKGA